MCRDSFMDGIWGEQKSINQRHIVNIISDHPMTGSENERGRTHPSIDLKLFHRWRFPGRRSTFCRLSKVCGCGGCECPPGECDVLRGCWDGSHCCGANHDGWLVDDKRTSRLERMEIKSPDIVRRSLPNVGMLRKIRSGKPSLIG